MNVQYDNALYVLDNHCHVSFPQPIEESFDGYLYWFRELGISEAGMLSCPVSSHNETGMDVLENMKILYLKDRFPFPTYAYFGFTEHWNDPDKYAEFARTMLAMGFDGFKSLEEHPHDRRNLGKGLNHPSFSRFFEVLDQKQVPGVFHVGDPRPNWDEGTAYAGVKELGRLYGPDFLSLDELYDEMEQIITQYPNIRFIMAHFYFISDNYDRACRLLEENPNLHFDLTPGGEMFINFSKDPEKWREFFIRYRHRILLGSDHYALGYGNSRYHLARNYLEGTESFLYQKKPIYPLHLPKDILEDIYCNNAKRLAGNAPRPVNHKLAYDHCCYIRDNLMAQLTDLGKQNLKTIMAHFQGDIHETN